jgi:hypothetical protein
MIEYIIEYNLHIILLIVIIILAVGFICIKSLNTAKNRKQELIMESLQAY